MLFQNLILKTTWELWSGALNLSLNLICLVICSLAYYFTKRGVASRSEDYILFPDEMIYSHIIIASLKLSPPAELNTQQTQRVHSHKSKLTTVGAPTSVRK